MSTNTGEQERSEPVYTSVSRYQIPTADELRELRVLAGESIRDTAEALGVDKDTICRWEQGKSSPSIENAQALLEHYADAADGQTQLG